MKISPALKNDLKIYLLKRISDKSIKKTIEVQTPYPLDSVELSKIKKNIGGDSIEIKNTIHPELLGGFVLIDGSEMFDASLQGKLNKIVNSLLLH